DSLWPSARAITSSKPLRQSAARTARSAPQHADLESDDPGFGAFRNQNRADRNFAPPACADETGHRGIDCRRRTRSDRATDDKIDTIWSPGHFALFAGAQTEKRAAGSEPDWL